MNVKFFLVQKLKILDGEVLNNMFEKTILHLQREIRARNEIANDTTGVVTQYSKDQAISDAKEFQEVINVLKDEKTTLNVVIEYLRQTRRTISDITDEEINRFGTSIVLNEDLRCLRAMGQAAKDHMLEKNSQNCQKR